MARGYLFISLDSLIYCRFDSYYLHVGLFDPLSDWFSLVTLDDKAVILLRLRVRYIQLELRSLGIPNDIMGTPNQRLLDTTLKCTIFKYFFMRVSYLPSFGTKTHNCTVVVLLV